MSATGVLKPLKYGEAIIKKPGMHTLLVDCPGRIKYWRVGVPPSGAMDDLSYKIGNKILNNKLNDPSLEITYQGPVIEFQQNTNIALTGAQISNANINGKNVPFWESLAIKEGDVLDLSSHIQGIGARCYLSIEKGFVAPTYLGSKTSFPLGKLGGKDGNGSVLLQNDIIQYNGSEMDSIVKSSPMIDIPSEFLDNDNINYWEIGVLPGPQSYPEYLTENDFNLIFNSEYEVSHNASRLGIRLIGPKFEWARPDGGEGGSHSSNLIDNPYAIGTINFTGDSGVVLTVDGPSLGGFVCPVTIPTTQFWKIGQVKPYDIIKFYKMSLKEVVNENNQRNIWLINSDEDKKRDTNKAEFKDITPLETDTGLLHKIAADNGRPYIEYRMAGDTYIMIEYGDINEVDLNHRFRINELEKLVINMNNNAIIDTIPGVRTLLIQYNPNMLTINELMAQLIKFEDEINVDNITINSRIWELPLLIEDEWTLSAIQRYISEVRPKAAYLPSNVDFVCKNNGIQSKDDFKKMIYDTSYMVLGLGDVYLGAPCAIPVDPRHRLSVPKYNPSRNFTPEGAVGIGGQYMYVNQSICTHSMFVFVCIGWQYI